MGWPKWHADIFFEMSISCCPCGGAVRLHAQSRVFTTLWGIDRCCQNAEDFVEILYDVIFYSTYQRREIHDASPIIQNADANPAPPENGNPS